MICEAKRNKRPQAESPRTYHLHVHTISKYIPTPRTYQPQKLSDFKKRGQDSNWPNEKIEFSTKKPHEYFTPPGWELYDLQNDPFEMNNLYGKSGYEKITDKLKKEILSLRSEFDEEDTNYPHIQSIIDQNWNK